MNRRFPRHPNPSITLTIGAAVLAALLPSISPGAEASADPAAGILHRAVARAEAQYENQAEAVFESEALSVIRSLDAMGRPVKTETFRYRQYPLGGALFEELIEKDGRPLGEGEKREEQKRRERFLREVEKRRSQGRHPQPEQEPGIRFNHDFVDRYEFRLEGTETVRGHPCWVIAFKPAPGKLPVRNRMDRALNQSTGRFWIAREDYGAVRIEFALRHPFKYWGGLLAVIRNTDGRMDYERVAPDIWTPLDFDLRLDLEIMMVKDIRRTITKNWVSYRAAGGPGPSPLQDR
ncbi:MAG: hypothetical protein JXP48_06865 [Acidobacteria bacterium]|nr:hypothetical protein [Acidobacteriota bacterium]